ncbi:glutamine--fructose-6-phosphate transaminase (isomerizing) [Candidatus Azambacteria bacterium]|nr:glutamine--fructose-6-phosphate transaminase (isomerizing) [Candidatus Azambacteria bacterium]
MCGIVGYIGKKEALPVLLAGLKRLEYRGYDSAGVAVIGEKVQLAKSPGRIFKLEKVLEGKNFSGNVGIAHTRWATHGKPTKANAHPHIGCNDDFLIAHNGIIENYLELKSELLGKGHKFRSQTDSEVFAHLLEEEFKHYHNFEASFKSAISKIRGAYGIIAISKKDKEKILIAKKSSPIVIGVGKNEHIIASDLSAVIGYTKDVIHLSDDEIAVCESDGVRISNLKNEAVGKKARKVEYSLEEAEKGNFETFMKKEIFESPEVIKNAIRGRLLEEEGTAKFGGLEEAGERLKNVKRVMIVACGTSYYAGLLAKYWFSDLTHLHTDVEIASEFKTGNIDIESSDLVIAISQSGETADTLGAVREAKKRGALTMGIVNVVGSAISQETDIGIYNHAGPEISVASTKAFISQATVLALLTIFFARQKNMSLKEGKDLMREISGLYAKVGQVLGQQKTIQEIAEKYAKYKNFIFLGRKYNFPIALEGALKLKEVSYIHAEGYAGGELKHGPLAMIDKNFPVFCISTKGSVYDKMLSNMEEIKSRGGKVICVATAGDKKLENIADDVVYVPRSSEMLSPILAVVVTQLFAYFLARVLKRDIDKPRNLAKSVTVE